MVLPKRQPYSNYQSQSLIHSVKTGGDPVYSIVAGVCRDGFGPGPAQPKSARAYIATWPKIGPGPKAAQRTPAQIGLGPNFFGPGPAQEIFGPKK